MGQARPPVAGRRAAARYLDAYARPRRAVLLLWASDDRYHPLETAEDALRRLPDGQLRVLPGTGFLMAYDDPVGARPGAGQLLLLR